MPSESDASSTPKAETDLPPPKGPRSPPADDVYDRLRQQAIDLHRQLVAETLVSRSTDEARAAQLERLLELIGAPSRLERQGRLFTIALVASLTMVSLLVLAFAHRPAVETVVDVTAVRATLDVTRERNATAGLFAPSPWVDLELVRAAIPRTCSFHEAADHPALGSHLRAQSLDDAFPISIGDVTPLPENTAITYDGADEGSLALTMGDSGNRELQATLGVLRGTLTMRSYLRADPPAASCELDGDELEVRARRVRFAPQETIGPLSIRGVDFDERRAVGTRNLTASTILSGTIAFRSIPGKREELPRGTRLRIGVPVDGDDLIAYVSPEKDGVRVVMAGRLSVLDDSGKDIRPVLLEELWESPYLKLIAAAFASVFPLILWLLGRVGLSV